MQHNMQCMMIITMTMIMMTTLYLIVKSMSKTCKLLTFL